MNKTLDFITFCKAVFEKLHPYVHLWLTFNSPEGHAAQGWLQGTKPPGKRCMPLMGQVLKNLLEAHVRVYKALKTMDGGQKAKIGILKNIFQLDPWDAANPIHNLKCSIGNMLVNTSVYDFFKTGTFRIYIPFKVNISYTSNELVQSINQKSHCLDFMGLNYYSHGYMATMGSALRDEVHEIPTQNSTYTIYAEGFYRALMEIQKQIAGPFGVPIYVTENGIAPLLPEHNTLFTQRYMYALARAITEGCNVYGYIRWAGLTNVEWGSKQIRYGLIDVDFNTQQRTIRPESQYYSDLVSKSLA